MKTKTKPKITISTESVVVDWKGMRYEVYFDTVNYSIFVGEPNNGSLVKIPRNKDGKLEYWLNW